MLKSVRLTAFLLGVGFLILNADTVGQEKGPKKEEPKEAKKADVKEAKTRGYLPNYWKQIGLTDEQKQKVYKLQGKYGEEIDALEDKIKELKAKLGEERMKVLTADQKKRLEDIIRSKAGTDK